METNIIALPSVRKKMLLRFYHIFGWVLFTIIVYMINQTQHGTIPAVYISIIRMSVAVFFAYCLSRYYDQHQQKSPDLTRLLLLVPLFALPPAAIQTLINQLVHIVVDPYSPDNFSISYQINVLLFWEALFITWSILYISVSNWSVHYDRELQSSEKQRLSAEAELNTLRSQINSHFLFNALNSVIAEADSDPARVKQITQTLANYLRFSLVRHRHKTPFKEEINAIRNQLIIEKFRFEDNIEFDLRVSEEVGEAITPLPLIQTIVENAVKYGMQTSIPPLQIWIHAHTREQQLHIEVGNTGKWVDQPTTPSTRIGLNNLRRRLQLLYPDKHSLEIQRDCPGIVIVRITIPLEYTEPV